MNEDPASVVERGYDERAESFATRWFGARVEPLTGMFANRLAPGSRVVDLGCGPGRDAVRLAALGMRVFGLDRSAGVLDEARRRQVTTPLIRADIRRIPLADHCLDGVWACASFLHLPRRDLAIALAECRRVLKPRGVMALAMKQGTGEGWEDRDGTPLFFAYYQAQELTRALRHCGFRPETWWHQNDSAGRSTGWINVLARLESDEQETGQTE